MFSWSSFGQDFSSADAKFNRRNESLQTLLEARADYRAILDNSAKNSDYLRAADQYLRTLVFEATHYNKDPKNVQQRRQIYLKCAAEADATTSPSLLHFEYVGYYYFKSRCILGAIQNSTEFQFLPLLSQLNSLLSKGLETQGGMSFEGGGLIRIRASLKSDPRLKGIPGGTYNPENALELIDFALKTDAYPGSMEGGLYLDNYVEKIRILQVLRSETGASTYATRAYKLAIDTIFLFNDYLSDELFGNELIVETQDALESIGRLEPEAMKTWKSKMELQKELLEDLVTATEARDAYEALSLLAPAFKAYDKVVTAMIGDTSMMAGVAGAVKILQECQPGQEGDPLCDTRLDELISSERTTEDQRKKLRTLKDLLDGLPENTPPSCEGLSRDECVKTYLKLYLTPDDIKILESARKSLEVVKNAPDLYKKYATRVKELEEQIEATRHP
jgi:hypothetical protein